MHDSLDSAYFSNIAKGTTEEQLHAALAPVVKPASISIVKNKQGEARGYAFVKFDSKADLYKALDMEPPLTFKDAFSQKELTVKISVADPKNVLFVGKLPKDMSETKLLEALSELAKEPILKFELATSNESESKGYGWATFADHEVALKALKNLQTSPLDTVSLNVAFARLHSFDDRLLSSVKVLYVKNLTQDTTSEQLQELVDAATVEKISLPKDQSEKNIGHGFLHFKERADAEKAKEALTGKELNGRLLHVEWGLPDEAKRSKQRQQRPGTRKATSSSPNRNRSTRNTPDRKSNGRNRDTRVSGRDNRNTSRENRNNSRDNRNNRDNRENRNNGRGSYRDNRNDYRDNRNDYHDNRNDRSRRSPPSYPPMAVDPWSPPLRRGVGYMGPPRESYDAYSPPRDRSFRPDPYAYEYRYHANPRRSDYPLRPARGGY
eukprot:NODE_1414_length_1513_cov_293.145743_g1339_i0.p1 GENE.NODE_1414_length_1513_cov_293.145743_g1339_i0~~NODE_1414_length_1513_cov_293.145743_g1339_i0.p1  ORF type:complete len:436 (-),score=74.82 NODE_1414_length_1513_cov_293.145743_g1339_i0:145-1452(-)